MYRIRLSRLMVIIQHTHSENMASPYQIRMVSTTEAVFQSKRLKCAAIAASSDRRTRINGYINFLLFILWCSQQVEVECKNKRTNEHQNRAYVDPFCLSASFFFVSSSGSFFIVLHPIQNLQNPSRKTCQTKWAPGPPSKWIRIMVFTFPK